jgi:hypothetical protein
VTEQKKLKRKRQLSTVSAGLAGLSRMTNR